MNKTLTRGLHSQQTNRKPTNKQTNKRRNNKVQFANLTLPGILRFHALMRTAPS